MSDKGGIKEKVGVDTQVSKKSVYNHRTKIETAWKQDNALGTIEREDFLLDKERRRSLQYNEAKDYIPHLKLPPRKESLVSSVEDVFSDEIQRRISVQEDDGKLTVSLIPAMPGIVQVRETFSGDGQWRDAAITLRLEPTADFVQSIPFEERHSFLKSRPVIENLRNLVLLYNEKGIDSLAKPAVEEGTVSTVTLFPPEWSEKDRARVLAEYGRAIDTFLSDIEDQFTSEQDYWNFCNTLKNNTEMKLSIFKGGNVAALLNEKEILRDKLYQRRFSEQIATFLWRNFKEESTDGYGIHFTRDANNTLIASVVEPDKKDEGKEEPIQGDPHSFRYGDFRFTFEDGDRIKLSIVHVRKPYQLILDQASQITNVDEIREAIMDENSDDWTRVADTFPMSVHVKRTA